VAPWGFSHYIHIIPPHLIPEHKSVPEHVLSQITAFKENEGDLASGGRQIFQNLYHIPIIRQKFTASLPRILGPMEEELEMAFKEEWEQSWMQKKDPEGWVDIEIFWEAMKIVSRTTNRVFSGEVFCMKDTYALLSGRDTN